jgi:hypothetical protein
LKNKDKQCILKAMTTYGPETIRPLTATNRGEAAKRPEELVQGYQVNAARIGIAEFFKGIPQRIVKAVDDYGPGAEARRQARAVIADHINDATRETEVAASYLKRVAGATDPVHRRAFLEYGMGYQGVAQRLLEGVPSDMAQPIRDQLAADRLLVTPENATITE